MIGMLYHRAMLLRLMHGKRSFEQPAFYLQAAREIGKSVVFFSLPDIDWRKGTVSGWSGVSQIRIKMPIPPVIINRTRTNRQAVRQRIDRLKSMGKIIFNEHNVFSKLEVHHILSQNARLLPHLPATDPLTPQSIRNLLEHNGVLYLKPCTASIGNGIIRISRINNETFAEINRVGHTRRTKADIRQIVKMARKRSRHYLVQQGIRLKTFQNKPVDFRVSMQKDGAGRWQYNGAVGKLGKKQGSIVTNLHCGGTSIKASELFHHWGWNGSRMERKFAKLGLRIARTLERELPHVADLGLDIALDDHQHPWFIEANFRDLRITFRNAGEMEKWRITFTTPVQYAAFLSGLLDRTNSHETS